ncbi:hypothetical protein [Paraglaciecola sp.]|uniref:hypothetical protein n=1 Tax=Paraglaciecola sp. TaxID=1920173 RepID=UPI003EFA7109
MYKICIMAFVITLTSCSNSQSYAPLNVTPIAQSELKVIENSHFDRFVIAEDANFNQFDKVIFFPMQFDRMAINKNADKTLRDSWNDSTWKEMDAICQYFDDFAQKIFAEHDGLSPTNKGGNNVLAVEFRLIDFMPHNKRYKDASLGTVGTSTDEKGVGTITFQAVIAHSQTGDLIAVIEDGMEVNSIGSMNIPGNLSLMIDSNNKASQNRAWRRVFKRWVSLLHDDLTRLQDTKIELVKNI